MDLLTRTDLEELGRPDRDGCHVSLFIPTHRFGDGVEGDPIRWKNALAAVESVLLEGGMRRPDAEALLAPARALERDRTAWQHMSDGLAMFLRPGEEHTFRVPVDVPEVATVGERFVVGPLLRILTGDEHFLLLAVSQRELRLLEGSRHRADEVVLPDVPSDLRDVVAEPEPRSDTMAFSTSPAGRRGPAVFYGHGAADEDFKRDEVERFLRRVAEGLDGYLAGEDLPLVLVGLEPSVGMYRGISRYRHIMDDAVTTNPDRLSAEELHAAAWPVVAQRLREEKQRTIERFEELHGTGRASTDPAKIANAAVEGRVDTLFIPADPSCWEAAATQAPTVLRLGCDDDFAGCEQLDRAAVETLSRGGHMYAVAESPMPGGGEVAAVFRY